MDTLYSKMAGKFSLGPGQTVILVDVSRQTLSLLGEQDTQQSWPVSTAAAGTGNRQGSLQTPLGAHAIADKIGDDMPLCSIFKGRMPTGAVADINNTEHSDGQDLVTTRILWLKGLESGHNLGGDVDTQARYIYIHGTPEEGLIGQPASHGCIRMRNADVIELFNRVDIDTPVYICESQNRLNLV